MTEQERNEYRQRMRTAKTEEERERIRADHHKRMKERAKERGVTLPDEPPVRGGMGRGPGGGPGPGKS
jgi:1,2-phenylacetyl-CoA epoxidase catalytic subunit